METNNKNRVYAEIKKAFIAGRHPCLLIEVICGEYWLVGEDGIVLRMDGSEIRMDVIGDPYVQLKDCEDEGSPLAQFCGLKSINQITPNAEGDFKLRVGGNLVEDPVVRIVPITNGVRIEMVGMKGEMNQNA